MCYQQDLLYINKRWIHRYRSNSCDPRKFFTTKNINKIWGNKIGLGPAGVEKQTQTWNQVWTNKNISITTTTQWCFSDASLQRPGLWEWPAVRTTKLHGVRRCWTLVWGPSQRNSRSNLQNCRSNLLIVEVTNSSAREPGVFFNQQLRNSKQQKWERTCPKCGKSLLTPLLFSRDPWYMVSLFFFLVLSGLSVMKFCTSYEVFSW